MLSIEGAFTAGAKVQEPFERLRILIVDDVGVVRANLREWLEAVFPAAHVLEAFSGETAVALIESEKPQLVVMDVALPGINGIEATRRIKAIRPETRVAMLTIHEELDYQREAAAAGADAYIFKGRMASELVPALTRLVALARECQAAPREEG